MLHLRRIPADGLDGPGSSERTRAPNRSTAQLAPGDAVTFWLEEGAALYVCGNGRGVAAGVKQVVTAVLGARLGEQEGQDFVKKMVTERKYKEDI